MRTKARAVPNSDMGESVPVLHEVRGPDPDGDWFVVQIDGDEETALDEAFDTEAKAQAAADRLNA